MKIWIVTGGKLSSEQVMAYHHTQAYDCLIAVDKGADMLRTLDIRPAFAMGDFDSVNRDVLEGLVRDGVEVCAFMPEKDLTDTHLAFEKAVSLGATSIMVHGATGTRADHFMSNIMTAFHFLKTCDITFEDENNRILFFEGPSVLTLKKSNYQNISIVPIDSTVVVTNTVGLKYPLKHEILYREASRGISNEFDTKTENSSEGTTINAAIEIESGKGLLILSND